MQISVLNNNFIDQVIALIRVSDLKFSWSDKQILDSLNKDTCFGLFEVGKLKAVVILKSVLDSAELLYVCVDKSSQNAGVGYSVLKHIFSKCLDVDIKQVFLEVSINNQKAIKLYQNLGFKILSVRKNYYKEINGEYIDALIYRLDISN